MTTRGQYGTDKEANELSKNGTKRDRHGAIIPRVKSQKIYKKNYRFERNK